MRKIARALSLFFCLMVGTGCTHLMYPGTHMLYFSHPEALDKGFQLVDFKSADGTKLVGWYFPAQKKPVKGTVIQFHGNGENMSSHFMSLVWLTNEGYNLLAWDYRGYGISEGESTQKGLNDDAQAAIRFILKRNRAPAKNVPPDVILYGQSLGGAVVMRAIADLTPEERRRVRAIVIESSFSDYHAIARDVLSRSWVTWLFQPLGSLLISDAYSPEEYIPKISPIPMLIFHGDDDSIVPLKFGQKVFELAKEPKQFVLVKGGHHIDAMDPSRPENRTLLLRFLNSKR